MPFACTPNFRTDMFVFPMMGQSSRFTRAGYTMPKYQLPLAGTTVFTTVLAGFRHYFDTDLFLFAIPASASIRDNITKQCRELGIRHTRIVELPAPTAGQADTVYQALPSGSTDDDELIVFNIDTLRPGFRKPTLAADDQGCLEVFEGEGEHWSFIEPGPAHTVLRTTEKQRISHWCSNGLYQFSTAQHFRQAFEAAQMRGLKTKGEYYIAPLYNHLIEAGLRVTYQPVSAEDMLFCGTPHEYETLRRLSPQLLRERLELPYL